MRFACIFVPDFILQASLRSQPGLRNQPLAIVEGDPPLLRVVAVHPKAREAGVEVGMTKAQAEAAGAVVRLRSQAREQEAHAALMECAWASSPHVEARGADSVLLDVSGMERLWGSPEQIAADICERVRRAGLTVNVAIAAHADTAALAAVGSSPSAMAQGGPSGICVIRAPEQIAPLPLTVLDLPDEIAATLELWGIRNLAGLAALPAGEVSQRLGQAGVQLQKLARGEQVRPFLPTEREEASFDEVSVLEDPVELLDALLLVLAGLLEAICRRLRENALAILALQLELRLDPPKIQGKTIQGKTTQEKTTQGKTIPEERLLHCRTIALASPTLDSKLWLKLWELDLRSHPPKAPVIAVRLHAQGAKPRHLQTELFAPAAPEPERLQLTIARLKHLMGEGEVGSAELIHTHRPNAFFIRSFDPEYGSRRPGHTSSSSLSSSSSTPCSSPPRIAFRFFEPLRRIHVELCDGVPLRIGFGTMGGEVLAHAGPWSKSGDWWNAHRWAREEWDVEIQSKEGETERYRLYQDLITQEWFAEGSYD